MMEPEKGTSIQTYCLFGVPEPTLPRYIVEPWVHLDPSPPIPHPPMCSPTHGFPRGGIPKHPPIHKYTDSGHICSFHTALVYLQVASHRWVGRPIDGWYL